MARLAVPAFLLLAATACAAAATIAVEHSLDGGKIYLPAGAITLSTSVSGGPSLALESSVKITMDRETCETVNFPSLPLCGAGSGTLLGAAAGGRLVMLAHLPAKPLCPCSCRAKVSPPYWNAPRCRLSSRRRWMHWWPPMERSTACACPPVAWLPHFQHTAWPQRLRLAAWSWTCFKEAMWPPSLWQRPAGAAVARRPRRLRCPTRSSSACACLQLPRTCCRC